MKLLKSLLLLFFIFSLVACGTSSSTSRLGSKSNLKYNSMKSFHQTSRKVGIILNVNKIDIIQDRKEQSFLASILTPGFKFYSPLFRVEKDLAVIKILEKEITKTLKSKDKPYLIISEKINFPRFKKSFFNISDYFSDTDYRVLKDKYNIDEVLYVNVSYGLSISYIGVVEISKKTVADIQMEIVDLLDNAVMHRKRADSEAFIYGGWKKGKNYANLRKSFKSAIYKSINEIIIVL